MKGSGSVSVSFTNDKESLPTGLSSMMPWALDLAADMLAGLTLRWKNRRRKDMMAVLANVDEMDVCFAIRFKGREEYL